MLIQVQYLAYQQAATRYSNQTMSLRWSQKPTINDKKHTD